MATVRKFELATENRLIAHDEFLLLAGQTSAELIDKWDAMAAKAQKERKAVGMEKAMDVFDLKQSQRAYSD